MMIEAQWSEQLAAVHAEIAPALPRNVEPRTVELAAFTAVGERDLAMRLWTEARDAADAARRSVRAGLRERHGSRRPGGWPLMVLLVGALCAAVAAVLSSGLRFDPADTVATVVTLSGLAALACIVVMIAARGRALNRAVIRLHGVATVGLVLAAVFTVGRGWDTTAMILLVTAAIGVAGLVGVLVARARDSADTELVDTAENVALAETKPEVEAVGLRLRAETEAALDAATADRIVALRDTVLAEIAARGITLEPVPPRTPAGSVIIDALLATWVPEVMRGEV
ncbi:MULTISPECIES: hypothetical protein [Microbacterium]|jgi:hypothetical protein|uniref:hypothetical protein n=1 Tax=Microbacterium TaxID=33882 RepID=UPI000E74BD90|nr:MULTISPECIES: hypothetical protein [Microbacterium]RKE64261.1 hypothetical protein DEU36_1484 [Microbacterium sp. AG238]WJM16127.1 hypothetical protein QUC20_02095 [Microbacterium arborescens]